MSISESDFKKSCRYFQSCWQNHQTENESWLEVKLLEQYGAKYLRIVKSFQLATEEEDKADEGSLAQDEDEVMEEDQEVLESFAYPDYNLLINYDIVYSPTYQVPVLYITFQQPPNLPTTGLGNVTPQSVDVAYELLVPASLQAQIKEVGVMGALSMTDHPVAGTPAYFVHPCRTADVMGDLFVVSNEGEPADWNMYLLIWIGLVGGSVGLDVSAELAERLMADVR